MKDPQDQLAAVGAEPAPHREARSVDLGRFIQSQIQWSTVTFGPGERSVGLSDHIRKELEEVYYAPNAVAELGEWVDIVILALDAAWRLGFTPEDICRAMLAKAEINRGRGWPDWRTAEPGRAIEHVR